MRWLEDQFGNVSSPEQSVPVDIASGQRRPLKTAWLITRSTPFDRLTHEEEVCTLTFLHSLQLRSRGKYAYREALLGDFIDLGQNRFIKPVEICEKN